MTVVGFVKNLLDTRRFRDLTGDLSGAAPHRQD
jgi:hypothetical protein